MKQLFSEKVKRITELQRRKSLPESRKLDLSHRQRYGKWRETNDTDNGDYYISPEQFKNGSKRFQVLATPNATFYVTRNSQLFDIGDTQAKALFERVGGDESNFSGGKGYIVDGYVSAGKEASSALIAYYVNGGPEGTGYMYVNFPDDITDTFGASLAHVLGGINPGDVQYNSLGDSNVSIKMADGTNVAAYIVPPVSRVLLISMKGIAIVVKYLFQERMCEISLLYASYTGDLESATKETPDVPDNGAYQTTFEQAVVARLPYVPVSSGS